MAEVPVEGFNPTVPNVARVYDYWLGGKENFAADRDLADRLETAFPTVREICRHNREFVVRAVTWAAGQGIAQFLDLGAGLPTHPAVHEAAREVVPDARVCYVDNDRLAVLHATSLLATAEGVSAAEADLADPRAVQAQPDIAAAIDRAQPVCVIMAMALHFMDAGTARRIAAGYVSRIVPGSIMVISCIRNDDPELWRHGRDNYTAATMFNHTRDELRSFFSGLDLIAPGIVPAHAWRAGMDAPSRPPGQVYVLGGVAVKRPD